jgi:hypothetical protein
MNSLIRYYRIKADEALYMNLDALTGEIAESTADPSTTADAEIIQKALSELRTWTMACNGEPKRWYQ